jgi:two-component system, LytTR family, response regulator
MSKYPCVIIDDESLARKLLSAMLEAYCPELEVVAECADLPTGVKAIKKHGPKLVFLDIEMPGYSGLELLDFFDDEEISFDVIFTTAYNEYAIQAFRFSAIDYLLKPLQQQQLKDAVQRFVKKTERESSNRLTALKSNLNADEPISDKRIVVPIGQSLKFLRLADIVMIKGDGAYSEVLLRDGEKILASKNLKHFEEMLEGIPRFFRSHKSYIINVHEVIEYSKSDGGVILMKDNNTAGISPDKLDEFMKLMQGSSN